LLFVTFQDNILITSIPPMGVDPNPQRVIEVRTALESFSINGFNVVSLLARDEAPEPRFAESVVFLRSDNPGFFPDRYGPSFKDIFGKRIREGMIAVVNADVYMLPSGILPLTRESRNSVFLSRRINVSKLGGSFEGVYRHGIDAMFFSPDVDCERIAQSELAGFQLGAPFWDAVIPIALSFHNQVRFLSPPVLLHPSHELNWSDADYKFLREKAVTTLTRYAEDSAAESPRARSFLQGMEAFKNSFSRRTPYRDQKRAAEYIALTVRQMQSESLQRVEIDFNDAYLRESLIGLLETDDEALGLASKVFPYSGRPQVETNGYLEIARILLRARKSRANAKLAQSLFAKL
jgi:hypothetical protein